MRDNDQLDWDQSSAWRRMLCALNQWGHDEPLKRAINEMVLPPPTTVLGVYEEFEAIELYLSAVAQVENPGGWIAEQIRRARPEAPPGFHFIGHGGN